MILPKYGICLIFVLTLLSCRVSKEDSNINSDVSKLQNLIRNSENVLLDGVYDLEGAKLYVAGTISFDKESKIVNGTIVGNDALVDCKYGECLEHVKILGTWKNQISSLAWFTNGEDSNQNFAALRNALVIGDTVDVRQMYSLSLNQSGPINLDTDIIIRGRSEDSGFILLNKSNRNKQAYFRSDKGNNVHLENLTIVTHDYRQNIKPHNDPYTFASSSYSSIFPEASPDLSYFRIINCSIKGDINFNYHASPSELTPNEFINLGIDEIEIRDSDIDEVSSFLTLSNGGYDQANIINNSIRNISGPVFFFPVSGLDSSLSDLLINQRREEMLIKDNTLLNTTILKEIKKGYLSLVVAKGKDFFVVNNQIENVLTTKGDVETVPFYCSAQNYLLVKDNKVKDVASSGLDIGFGANCLLKLKGANNCDIINNEFRLTETGLKKLGIKISDRYNPSFSESFRFSILGVNLSKRQRDNYYNIEGNVFETVLLNDYSLLSRKNIVLRNNKFYIHHIAKSHPQKWGGRMRTLDNTLFYLREAINGGQLRVEDNTILVDEIDGETLHFTYDIHDNKSLDSVIYLNNVFELNGTVSFAYPRSNVLISKNYLKGEGSFAYSHASTARQNRSIKTLISEQYIDSYKASRTGAYHLKNFGSSLIKSDNNKDSIITVLQVVFNDLYFYNDVDQLPISLTIEGKFEDKRGKIINKSYKVAFSKKGEMFFTKSGKRKSMQISPTWSDGKSEFQYFIHPFLNDYQDDIKLSIRSSSRWDAVHKMGYIVISGISDIKKFEVKASVEKIDLPSDAKEKEFLRRSF